MASYVRIQSVMTLQLSSLEVSWSSPHLRQFISIQSHSQPIFHGTALSVLRSLVLGSSETLGVTEKADDRGWSVRGCVVHFDKYLLCLWGFLML